MDINAARFTKVKSALHERGWQIQHLKPKIVLSKFLNYSSLIKEMNFLRWRLKLKHQYHT